MSVDWPQTWDLSPLYTGVDDRKLVEDIDRVVDHGLDWQSARRRAWGYLYLLSASGVCDDLVRADVAKRMAQLQNGERPISGLERFVAGWQQDRALGLVHPLARAAEAGGLDWRGLVCARHELQSLAGQLSAVPPPHGLHSLSWNDCVDLVLTSAAGAGDRTMMVDLLRGRRVDAALRPGKLSRPLCLAPDPVIGPFVSMRALGKLGDALVLAHELQHAIDEVELDTPPPPLAAEMSARLSERRLLSRVSAIFGAERILALVRERQNSELIEPLRTLIAQVEAAETLLATGHTTSDPAHAAAFLVPPLYPVVHVKSYLAVFTDLPLPPETADLYRRLAELLETMMSPL